MFHLMPFWPHSNKSLNKFFPSHPLSWLLWWSKGFKRKYSLARVTCLHPSLVQVHPQQSALSLSFSWLVSWKVTFAIELSVTSLEVKMFTLLGTSDTFLTFSLDFKKFISNELCAWNSLGGCIHTWKERLFLCHCALDIGTVRWKAP
jgi:hypothetical protein